MKVLLCKNVEKLGIVGDVVEVKSGYARNYLVPQGLATEPTDANMRRLAEARRQAELERAQRRTEMEKLAEKLEGVEVSIYAKANEEGHLYGSVGTREIAEALAGEQLYVKPDWIVLDRSIRNLDKVSVDLRLAEDLRPTIKVWVLREKAPGEEGDEESLKAEASAQHAPRMEAEGDGDESERD
ncbi:MAG: 50S ribosomal protein L9 [Phycisphaerae bacterium]|nr:50S ribosomal protein L9 [Phycisphaerae bacterium]